MENNEKSIALGVEKSLKSTKFWYRFIVGAVIAVLAYLLLPFGLTLTGGLLQMAIDISKTALIGAALFFGWSSRFLLKRFQDRIIEKFWEKFIYANPLDYIGEEVVGFEKDKGIVDKAIDKLRAVLDTLRTLADKAVKSANSQMELAEAQKDLDPDEAALYLIFAQRETDTIQGIKESYVEVEDSISVLEEMAKYLGLTIRNMKHALDQMRLQMQIESAKSSAADAARSVLQGDPNKRARLQMAGRAYQEQISAYSANFKSFMKDAEPILKAQRIKDAIATDKGRKALQLMKENKLDLGGLKDFNVQLGELKEKLGRNDKDYKVDFKEFQNKAPNSLTRNANTDFDSLM